MATPSCGPKLSSRAPAKLPPAYRRQKRAKPANAGQSAAKLNLSKAAKLAVFSNCLSKSSTTGVQEQEQKQAETGEQEQAKMEQKQTKWKA